MLFTLKMEHDYPRDHLLIIKHIREQLESMDKKEEQDLIIITLNSKILQKDRWKTGKILRMEN